MMEHRTKRDSWGSKWGFILACIGSAVGMGNIWLFPARVSAYGGATFLIPYAGQAIFFMGAAGNSISSAAQKTGKVGAKEYACYDKN